MSDYKDMSFDEKRATIKEQVQKMVEKNQEAVKTLEAVEETKQQESKPDQETDVSKTETVETDPTAELSEEEKEAYEIGWRPDHQGKTFVSAKEYLGRKPIFERIDRQNKEIQELKELFNQTAQHLSNTQRIAYERAIKDLQLRRAQAVEEADKDKFVEIEREIQDTTKQLQQDPLIHQRHVQTAPPVLPKEVEEFKERNKEWFGVDKDLTQDVSDIDAFFCRKALREGKATQDPNTRIITPHNLKDHFKSVEDELKRVHSTRFKNTKQDLPPAVGTSTSSKDHGKANVSLASRLSVTQLDMGKRFMKSNPKYTLEVYAKDLDAQGLLKGNK